MGEGGACRSRYDTVCLELLREVEVGERQQQLAHSTQALQQDREEAWGPGEVLARQAAALGLSVLPRKTFLSRFCVVAHQLLWNCGFGSLSMWDYGVVFEGSFSGYCVGKN